MSEKIFSRLEKLLKFRIYSNAEIPEYLKKLSNMGKLDEVRKQSLIILILTKLGEIEDKEEIIQPPSKQSYLMPDLPERREGTLSTPADPILPVESVEPVVSNDPLKCPDCPMVAKSKLGLISHSRKHKK